MTLQTKPIALLARGAVVVAGVALLAGCQTAGSPSTTGTPTPAARASSTTAIEASIANGGSGADRGDTATEEANLKLVTGLFSEAFDDPTAADAQAAAKAAIAPDAVGHGADAGTGPGGLLDEFTADHSRVPDARAVVKRTAADGDLVAVHWQLASDPDDERTGEAEVDLFRVTDGQITERWSFSQPIAPGVPASGNTNTMFSDLYEKPAGEAAPTEAQEESNRTFAVDAYNTLFRDQDPSVLDRSFDPNYLQHNTIAPNGTAALKGLFSGSAQFPAQQSVVSLADGDLVWTFSQSVDAKTGDPFLAADIFRVDDGLIREHWDVVPAAPVS